jgi:biofilm PGA synthesis N-glycosyltransferase PgaC
MKRQNQPEHPNYVLITAARNERDNIEKTIKSVVAQTARPYRWIVVSDGSTDGTDELVQKYCLENEWIELLRNVPREERHFGGKVEAFNLGYAHIKALPFDLIGNLDADLSFDKDFFAYLLDKFAENPLLGIAGAPFVEGDRSYDFRFSSIDHVSGACQLFRRECYDEIGGYTPVKAGGIDVIAVLRARMRGWQTKTFTEVHYLHHRKMGTAKESPLKARYRDGQKDYALGAHPVWVVFRSVYQMSKRPYVLSGVLLFMGYIVSMTRGVPRPISKELMKFRRDDQLLRLRAVIMKPLGGGETRGV